MPSSRDEPVAGSARNDRQRRAGERERRGDFVDRAVAAPGDAQRDAAAERRERQLARVAAALGDEHFAVRRRADAETPSASSARCRATSGRRPAPEIGLMMTATVSLTYASLRRIFGVTNQTSVPARFGREAGDVDAADAALLERQRPPRADQVRGQLAEIGLVADERDAPPLRRPSPAAPSPSPADARARARRAASRSAAVDAGREQIGGLPGAHQRAGEDLVDGRVELLQPADRLP